MTKSFKHAVVLATSLVAATAPLGCSSGGKGTTGTAGTGGAGGLGGGTGGTPVGVACGDTPPWTTTGTPAVTLTVDASSPGAPWSRFYENAVATDHANTVLTTFWGRNIQAALQKGHDQAGFQYARFHGILNDDINVYSEDASGAAVYDWTRFDMVYDALVTIGMRAIVEIGLTPTTMASDTTSSAYINWYDMVPANRSAPKDWTKWEAFMTAIVQHMEARYGAAEIQDNWYYEVWNEPSWMYSGGDSGYPELYQHTVNGLVAGDPLIRIGGPAETAGGEPYLVPTLITDARTNNLKLDFISYHHYGNDDNALRPSDPLTMQSFHHRMVTLLKSSNFTGALLNTEWGSTYRGDAIRDDESSASFIAKTIHLLGSDTPDFPPPTSLGWWTISDLYEEINTGAATAYRDAGGNEGNFGLLLKGDKTIPASFDVAKPAFNAFRLLHMMGDRQLATTGGSSADGTANGVATLSADGNTVAVLIYNHTTGTVADSTQPQNVTLADPTQSALVSLSVNNLPFVPTRVLQYVVDHDHSNSHTTWLGMGKPNIPSADQWTQLSASAELCYYVGTPSGTASWSASFPQYNYSVSLILLQR